MATFKGRAVFSASWAGVTIAELHGHKGDDAERRPENETGDDAAPQRKSAKDHALHKWVELAGKVAAHVRWVTGPRGVPKDLMGQTQEQAVHEAENQEIKEWSLGFSEYGDQQPDEQRCHGENRVRGTIDLNEP